MHIKVNKYNAVYSKINLGIEILRMICCFWVICFHYLGIQNLKKYKIFNDIYFHVPCFMIITFLLTYKIFESKNIIKLKQRFERLAIPYIIVPFIYFFLLFKSFYLNGNIKILIFDLLKQYITGHTFYGFFCLFTI